ncbi:MAG TPA: riboflavin synthase [Egibacteraceae bacterium]|nr:riboflavin synthase [Egibacteraceae bacterium]
MFTGIVEEVGTVREVRVGAGGATLDIACATVVADAQIGDSISVNGCCLTVTTLPSHGFTADLMGETLRRTSLGGLTTGSLVNLERALRADGRLGGHLVQGHVDGVGTVRAVEPHESWTVMRITAPHALHRYLVEKGSVTVDGTSLTVMETDAEGFAVGLIPHTLSATSLRDRVQGDAVNLEVDVIAKYVERMLRERSEEPS